MQYFRNIATKKNLTWNIGNFKKMRIYKIKIAKENEDPEDIDMT